jgi:hypothetical protein
MAIFFIKDGYSEKGPFSVDELKKRGIKKTTFVRFSYSDKWVEAENIFELRSIFQHSFKGLKIGFFIVVFVVSIYLISAYIFNLSYKSNVNSESQKSLQEELLPPPPIIDYKISKHDKRFFSELMKDCNVSGEKNELVNACNYTNSQVRNQAVKIAGHSQGEFNLGQICDLFDYCYRNWKYVNDPNGYEFVEYASNTISNGYNGDCDDFAVVLCSMILSIGGEARINFAYSQDSGHAFTEVNVGNTEIEDYITKRYNNDQDQSGIWTRIDKDGNQWLNLDWFAKHPGGKYFNYIHGTTFYILQNYCNDFTK